MSSTSKTFDSAGLLYGRISASGDGSNCIIFVNGIPRCGIRATNATSHQLIWSIEIAAGDRASCSTYGTGAVDMCYFYPKT